METAFRFGVLFDFIAMFAVLEYYCGWEILVIFGLVMVTPNPSRLHTAHYTLRATHFTLHNVCCVDTTH